MPCTTRTTQQPEGYLARRSRRRLCLTQRSRLDFASLDAHDTAYLARRSRLDFAISLLCHSPSHLFSSHFFGNLFFLGPVKLSACPSSVLALAFPSLCWGTSEPSSLCFVISLRISISVWIFTGYETKNSIYSLKSIMLDLKVQGGSYPCTIPCTMPSL